MGRFVGIDLGTTYSVVAYVNAQGKAEVIPNEHGGLVTPSVVYFGGPEPIVGDEAKERQEADETASAAFFKRNIDDSNFLLAFHGRDYSAVDLSALVLGALKQQAERFLREPVTDAVITVPAYFRHGQRASTLEAGRRAGLNVLKIISEPTAAALAYGLRVRKEEDKQVFLVYDLGGGTFDISLVSSTPTELIVQATSGDSHLGGKDWDDRLLEYLAMCFEHDFRTELLGDDINTLRVQAEKLKRSLSVKQQASLRVQAGGHTGSYTITRELFANLTRDLLARTQLLTEQLLAEAGVSWSDLNGVLPVGGSTRMPMVVDYIQEMSGKTPMTGINPDEAVGLGAAIQAAMEAEAQETLRLPGLPAPRYQLAGRKKTVDVIAHSLGLIVESADRTHYANSIIMRKNLPIPSTMMRPYQLRVRPCGRTTLEVFLTQGESADPQECSYLGRYVFSDFPPLREKQAILDITYEYDKNGIVHVSALEHTSQQALTLLENPIPADARERFAGSPKDARQREPLYIYLAFDVSGSMHTSLKREKPIRQAMQAAREFVNKCDLANTLIGLIAFSREVQTVQVATRDRTLILGAIDRLEGIRTGYSNEGDPFGEIYHHLGDAPGVRYAVVLADGLWVYQDRAIAGAQRCYRERCIETIAVGFGNADRRFLNQIASSPEQSFFTDLDKLVETFTTIAQELANVDSARSAGSSLLDGA